MVNKRDGNAKKESSTPVKKGAKKSGQQAETSKVDLVKTNEVAPSNSSDMLPSSKVSRSGSTSGGSSIQPSIAEYMNKSTTPSQPGSNESAAEPMDTGSTDLCCKGFKKSKILYWLQKT